MSPGVQRLLGAMGTVFVAVAVNLATGFFTGRSSVAWWAGGAVLLVLGLAVQLWLPVTAPPGPTTPARQNIRGTTVGGNAGQAMTSSGTQDVTDSQIAGDLDQQQGPTP